MYNERLDLDNLLPTVGEVKGAGEYRLEKDGANFRIDGSTHLDPDLSSFKERVMETAGFGGNPELIGKRYVQNLKVIEHLSSVVLPDLYRLKVVLTDPKLCLKPIHRVLYENPRGTTLLLERVNRLRKENGKIMKFNYSEGIRMTKQQMDSYLLQEDIQAIAEEVDASIKELEDQPRGGNCNDIEGLELLVDINWELTDDLAKYAEKFLKLWYEKNKEVLSRLMSNYHGWFHTQYDYDEDVLFGPMRRNLMSFDNHFFEVLDNSLRYGARMRNRLSPIKSSKGDLAIRFLYTDQDFILLIDDSGKGFNYEKPRLNHKVFFDKPAERKKLLRQLSPEKSREENGGYFGSPLFYKMLFTGQPKGVSSNEDLKRFIVTPDVNFARLPDGFRTIYHWDMNRTAQNWEYCLEKDKEVEDNQQQPRPRDRLCAERVYQWYIRGGFTRFASTFSEDEDRLFDKFMSEKEGCAVIRTP